MTEIPMQTHPQAAKFVEFGSVPVGGWFQERTAGAQHLKTSASTGMYHACGTRYEPTFTPSEIVLVQ